MQIKERQFLELQEESTVSWKDGFLDAGISSNFELIENSREDGTIQASHTGAFPSKNACKDV